jgi:hypothetical protein
MAKVNITIDGKVFSVSAGALSHPTLASMATPTGLSIPRLNIPALNQKFSSQDNININGNEIIVSSMS